MSIPPTRNLTPLSTNSEDVFDWTPNEIRSPLSGRGSVSNLELRVRNLSLTTYSDQGSGKSSVRSSVDGKSSSPRLPFPLCGVNISFPRKRNEDLVWVYLSFSDDEEDEYLKVAEAIKEDGKISEANVFVPLSRSKSMGASTFRVEVTLNRMWSAFFSLFKLYPGLGKYLNKKCDVSSL